MSIHLSSSFISDFIFSLYQEERRLGDMMRQHFGFGMLSLGFMFIIATVGIAGVCVADKACGQNHNGLLCERSFDQ